jgi:hypothetical protein
VWRAVELAGDGDLLRIWSSQSKRDSPIGEDVRRSASADRTAPSLPIDQLGCREQQHRGTQAGTH